VGARTRTSCFTSCFTPQVLTWKNSGHRTRAHLPRDPKTSPSHHMSPCPGTGSHTTDCGPPGGGLSNKDQSTNPPPAPLTMPWPARAAPRSSPLFAPRPFDTRVSRQTAREAVTSNCRRAVTPASCRGAACLMERLSDGSIQYSVFSWKGA